MSMRRGTTPKHVYRLKFEPPDGTIARIIYAQKPPGSKSKVLFVKTGEQAVIEGNLITTRLTQEETFRFDDKLAALIQIRLLKPDGTAPGSDVMRVSVEECLEEEVMTHDVQITEGAAAE